MTNSVDPDQLSHSGASDLGLHCLQRLSIPIFRVIRVRGVDIFLVSTQKLRRFDNFSYFFMRGLLGVVKVSCDLCHRGIQLILTYSLARPTILVAGKGREGMFLFFLFLQFHSCSSFFPVPLFHLRYYLFYLFSLFLRETTQNDP